MAGRYRSWPRQEHTGSENFYSRADSRLMTNQPRIDAIKTGTTRVGILLNPLSGQVRKHRNNIRQTITEIPHAIVQEATNTAEFEQSINALLQAEIDLLIIVGGDGTIHAILDLLFTMHPPEEWPVLAIVAGGTTNMTSLDLGIRGKPEHAISQLSNYLLQPQLFAPSLISRPILCIEQTDVRKTYGLFFGVGLIARGVKFSRSDVKQWGITGGIFTLFITLRSLAGMIFRQRQSDWAPVELGIIEPTGTVRKKIYLFALVSALNSLLLDIRPYWGKESAPLHMTMVDKKNKHFWRSLWPLVSGRGHKLKEQDGYHSHNINTIELFMDDEYIIDGELYQATSKNGPLRISATAPITFLVL